MRSLKYHGKMRKPHKPTVLTPISKTKEKKIATKNLLNNILQKPIFNSTDVKLDYLFYIDKKRLFQFQFHYIGTYMNIELQIHCVANVYAVWPVYNVKCLCSRGSD